MYNRMYEKAEIIIVHILSKCSILLAARQTLRNREIKGRSKRAPIKQLNFGLRGLLLGSILPEENKLDSTTNNNLREQFPLLKFQHSKVIFFKLLSSRNMLVVWKIDAVLRKS